MNSMIEIFFEEGIDNVSTEELINFTIYIGKNIIDPNVSNFI
jgi:hypothetical protein